MQDYYLHARAITRARAGLLERLRPMRRRTKVTPTIDLGKGVRLFDGYVTMAAAQDLPSEPALAMRVLSACVRQEAPVLPFTRDAISRIASDPAWGAALRASPEAAELFVELVCTVAETRTRRGSIVGEMHDIGLLLAMVPEFLPVTGRVPRHFYHVYTVDVHSVASLDRLRQLARGELAHEHPLATRLAAEIAQPRPLFLATLLHDVGKGWPDADGSRKNHSKAGADLCERILPRLGFSAEEVVEACQLVQQHLLMYHVATRRDLDDPATIEEFCRSVRGREGLRNLYLLTVSDLSTTSPTAMTSWKARMLDELYFAAEQHLAGHEPRADAERVARVREAVRAAWSGPTAPLEALLASMPERYLLANGAESIVQHARVVAERGSKCTHDRARHVAATPRPPSCASWPTTDPGYSPASPRPSRRAGSRCSRRRSTRGRSAIAAKPSTSSGCATSRRRDRRGRGVALPRLAARSRRRVRRPGDGGRPLALHEPARRRPGASGRAPRSPPRSCSTIARPPATPSSRCSRKIDRASSSRCRTRSTSSA